MPPASRRVRRPARAPASSRAPAWIVPRHRPAKFSYPAAAQPGGAPFSGGAELDFERIDFTGRVLGEADHFLSVNTNRDTDVGCAFGFELELRPPPTGQGPFVFGNDNISVDDNDFCYGGARPGRARQLTFAIFSLRPGDASLIITNIALRQ